MSAKSKRDVIDELQDDWLQERPELDTEPMGVVLRIQALAKTFSDLVSVKLQEFDLQWWQYDVLSALRRQGEPYRMAASELAVAGMLTSGAMTNRIDRLEEAGLVQRLADEKDRRRVLVQLTNAGLKLVDRASDERFAIATKSLAALEPQKRAKLSSLLRTLILSLDEQEVR